MVNLSTSASTEYPPVVFLSSPNMAVVDNTLQESESPVPVRLKWISGQRMAETKLVVRINISIKVVGSLVVEHVLLVLVTSYWLPSRVRLDPGCGVLNKCLVDHN